MAAGSGGSGGSGGGPGPGPGGGGGPGGSGPGPGSGGAGLSSGGELHPRTGRLVSLSACGRIARRQQPGQEFNHGLVLSREPLRDGRVFTVRIDRKVLGWAGGVWSGWKGGTGQPSVAGSREGKPETCPGWWAGASWVKGARGAGCPAEEKQRRDVGGERLSCRWRMQIWAGKGAKGPGVASKASREGRVCVRPGPWVWEESGSGRGWNFDRSEGSQ